MADADYITVHGDELQTLCEWFGAVQDLHPAYLEKKDYLLACRLYASADRRVSNEMLKLAGLSSSPDPHGIPDELTPVFDGPDPNIGPAHWGKTTQGE